MLAISKHLQDSDGKDIKEMSYLFVSHWLENPQLESVSVSKYPQPLKKKKKIIDFLFVICVNSASAEI